MSKREINFPRSSFVVFNVCLEIYHYTILYQYNIYQSYPILVVLNDVTTTFVKFWSIDPHLAPQVGGAHVHHVEDSTQGGDQANHRLHLS